MNTDEAVLFLMLERYDWLFQRGNTVPFYKFSINVSVVEENYPLRTIKISDLIEYSALIEDEAPCVEQTYLKIVY